jgi:hypothetical protein
MEDDLNFKDKEEDLNFKKIENDPNVNVNIRQHNFSVFWKMEDDLIFLAKWKTTLNPPTHPDF